MEITELIRYRRSLKRKNYSVHTVKSYVNILDQFIRWLTVPFSEVTRKEIGVYVDHLLRKRRTPKTITCHLQTIRLFFDYLINEEGMRWSTRGDRIFVSHGKGGKDRVVYMSEDARLALLAYLEKRSSKAKGLFLVQKGPMRGKPLSVRGLQKRIEYYARESGLND